MIGVSFEAKMQMILLVVLIVSLVNYWVGLVIPVNAYQENHGIIGPSCGFLCRKF
jgi:hypothetical protein